MRRRVRKRVVSGKKPQEKQTKKVSKSGKGKDGPLTLELKMTTKMLEAEVGHTPPPEYSVLLVRVGDGLLYRACKQDGQFGQRMAMGVAGGVRPGGGS